MDRRSGEMPIRIPQAEVLLEPNKFPEVSRQQVLELVRGARNIISENLGDWLPREDSAIVIWYTNAGQGAYLGKWRGKHHTLLTIDGPTDITDSKRRFKLIWTIMHELLHQKVAEVLEEDDINGLDIRTKLEHRLMTGRSDWEVASIIFWVLHLPPSCRRL